LADSPGPSALACNNDILDDKRNDKRACSRVCGKGFAFPANAASHLDESFSTSLYLNVTRQQATPAPPLLSARRRLVLRCTATHNSLY
jgi:hypothetical protein